MTKRVAKKGKGEKTQTATEVIVEGLQAATGVEVKQYQFTVDAWYRVKHSRYESELWEVFKGKADVTLSQIEAYIFGFELRDARHQNLEVDGLVGEFAHCDLGITRDCDALGGLFFPKRWVSKKTSNSVGNYTPDLAEAVTASCEPCKQRLWEDTDSYNRKAAEGERKLQPRFMKRESAERIATGRKQGTELRQRLDDKLSGIRGQLRARAGNR